jgi:hypothetical protein
MRKGLTAGTVALTAALLAASAFAAPALKLGPATHGSFAVYKGYYDGHKDGYVITDVSSKSQASLWHVNFAPVLKTVKGAPAQYFVTGRAAAGQLAVFGSEPGETSYNPLWDEFIVTWKPGVTPVLLVKDDQITSLQKAGKLTVTDPHIVLNAPITSVGSKATVMSFNG